MNQYPNTLQQDIFSKANQTLIERRNILRKTCPDYLLQEFEIYINNTFERLNSLQIEIEQSILEFKANLLIQSTRCWEGWDRYDYNDPTTKKFSHDPVMDIGEYDFLQNNFITMSLKIKPSQFNQLKLVKMAQERIRSKKYILQTIAKKSNITDQQLKDFFQNSEICLMVTKADLNGLVSWNGKKIYINQSLEDEKFVNVLCHEYCHAIPRYLKKTQPRYISPEQNYALRIPFNRSKGQVYEQCEAGDYWDFYTKSVLVFGGNPFSLLRIKKTNLNEILQLIKQ